VFGLGSLKSPLRGGLNALKAAGEGHFPASHVRPGTELLSGQHDLHRHGHAEALAASRALFQPTMAEQVVIAWTSMIA
jgi:hypothetical protein